MTRHNHLSVRLAVGVLAIMVLIGTFPPPSKAALLRGRLVRRDMYGNVFPMGGITVTVYNAALGRSAPSVTDATGMYYLNIPAGPYWLEIWVTNPPAVYQIQVGEPYTDIPPIFV